MFAFIKTLVGCSLVGLSLLMASCSRQPEKLNHKESETLIPRKLLFGNPEKAAPRLSPNGEKLAYLAPDSQNILNVWIRDLKSSKEKDQIVTSDKKRGIHNYLWQWDSEHILYTQDKDGDENWHLYQTNINTKETKDLTPYEGAKIELLDYDHKYPYEILVGINKRDPELFDVYRINLKTGQVTLDTENFGGIFSWLADHNLQIRVAQAYKKDGSTVTYVRDHMQAPWREFLVTDPNEISTDVVGFSADNQSIYLISSLDGNTSRLLKFDLATGKKEVIVEDAQYDLEGIMMHPTTYALEAAQFEKDRPDWVLLDPQLVPDFEQIRQICKGPFAIASRDLTNQQWVIAALSDQRPTHFYVYNRETKKAQFLFSPQPALEQYTLSPMLPISFTARDGMKIFGYLTLPAHKEPQSLPTVLLVHGGPWVRDTWGLQPYVQWLANRGYGVLQINYRGSTGYGKDYLNAGNREWAGKMHDDLLDGKKWMVDQGYADPSKVAMFGGSYGGYATLVGLAFTPEEFCCGVDMVGPSNLITLLQTIPPYWAPLKAQTDRRLGSLENDQEFLKSRSPLFKADQIRKPLLIGQGANDPRVKQAESDQIVAAMRKNQLPIEYLVFTDEGHGFMRPENRLKFIAAAEEFLTKYLGGQYQLPSIEENWDSVKR